MHQTLSAGQRNAAVGGFVKLLILQKNRKKLGNGHFFAVKAKGIPKAKAYAFAAGSTVVSGKTMNYDVNIENIVLACHVPAGTGTQMHRNRPSHGIALHTDGVKEYL